MSIEQEILNWDGKSSSDINAIYIRYYEDDDFETKIIASSGNARLQKGMTWLLKHHLEAGQKLESNKCSALFKLLPKLEQWESKLHILQCLPYLQISESFKNNVEKFLRDCLIDGNNFVRAWAYNGFYEISRQYPEYQNETKQLFEMAMRDEAASVKARIRNIMKKGF